MTIHIDLKKALQIADQTLDAALEITANDYAKDYAEYQKLAAQNKPEAAMGKLTNIEHAVRGLIEQVFPVKAFAMPVGIDPVASVSLLGLYTAIFIKAKEAMFEDMMAVVERKLDAQYNLKRCPCGAYVMSKDNQGCPFPFCKQRQQADA